MQVFLCDLSEVSHLRFRTAGPQTVPVQIYDYNALSAFALKAKQSQGPTNGQDKDQDSEGEDGEDGKGENSEDKESKSEINLEVNLK